ncbi:hypothetical protein L218DRAFT_950154 [Marasmius fiardii PR-910]|nr:hypothetical protein L218DRAFT_950154 [Marasmius fiardii PR-910]
MDYFTTCGSLGLSLNGIGFIPGVYERQAVRVGRDDNGVISNHPLECNSLMAVKLLVVKSAQPNGLGASQWYTAKSFRLHFKGWYLQMLYPLFAAVLGLDWQVLGGWDGYGGAWTIRW